jgi:predicted transcriptional regulator
MGDVEILHKNCNESNYHLPIFIAREFTKRASDYIIKYGIISFTSSDIEQVLQRKPPVFRSGKIQGLVVSIRPDFLARMIKNKFPQYYVKGGPLGQFLKKGQTLIFYSTHPEKSVRAVAEIKSIILDYPQNIWKTIEKRTIFSEKEYFAYVSQKQCILAIEIVNIKEIPPIQDEELDSIIPKKDRSGSYIDEENLNKIIRRKQPHKRKTLIKKD